MQFQEKRNWTKLVIPLYQYVHNLTEDLDLVRADTDTVDWTISQPLGFFTLKSR